MIIIYIIFHLERLTLILPMFHTLNLETFCEYVGCDDGELTLAEYYKFIFVVSTVISIISLLPQKFLDFLYLLSLITGAYIIVEAINESQLSPPTSMYYSFAVVMLTILYILDYTIAGKFRHRYVINLTLHRN